MTVTDNPQDMRLGECDWNNEPPPLTAQQVWPDERVPQITDAELAYRPLDPTIVSVFKHALAAEVKECSAGLIEYLHQDKADAQNPLEAAESAQRRLAWPGAVLSGDSLFDEDTNVSNLILVCAEKFISCAPFLCDRPMPISSHSPRPLYLQLAMACIGSLMAGEPEERSTTLWSHAIRRLVGQLEVDNREARKMNLTRAWVLLETYGLLSSDTETWKRTSRVHGYVETAMWRLVSDLAKLDSNDVARENNKSIIAYFWLIDLLRAIHFGQPATLGSSDILVNFSFPTPKPGNRSREDPKTDSGAGTCCPLQQITVILGMIHTIATVFRPMVEVEVQARPLQPNEYVHTYRPRIPFSPSSEMIDMRARVRGYLQAWQDQYYQHSCNSKGAASALLFHFCHMYLAFPDLQALVQLSGYPPRQRPKTSTPSNARASAIAMRLIRQIRSGDGKTALQHAWKILDVESGITCPLLDGIGSIWTPLVLFYASLVVWVDITSPLATAIDATGPSPTGFSHFHGSVRVLDLFQARLTALRAPCCRVMASLIDRLKTSKLTPSGLEVASPS